MYKLIGKWVNLFVFVLNKMLTMNKKDILVFSNTWVCFIKPFLNRPFTNDLTAKWHFQLFHIKYSNKTIQDKNNFKAVNAKTFCILSCLLFYSLFC